MLLALRILVGLVVILAIIWAISPREPVDLTIRFQPDVIGDDVDAYLTRTEGGFDDIRAGAAKQVIWAGEAGARTKIALVYIHGFSASAQELRPVPDRLSEELGANLFFTRLSGHGRDGAAMAEPRVNDWVNDLAEALEIGRRLGDQVIVLGMSTGAALATLVADSPTAMQDVKGMVFFSPNFAISNPAARLLSLPFARQWAPVIVGHERSFEPENERHAQHWTNRYPLSAVFPMAAMVNQARRQDHAAATVPALFVLSDQDQVVRPDVARRVAADWGAGAAVVALTMKEGDDPRAHVIAGDIMSPGQNDASVRQVLNWIAGL